MSVMIVCSSPSSLTRPLCNAHTGNVDTPSCAGRLLLNAPLLLTAEPVLVCVLSSGLLLFEWERDGLSRGHIRQHEWLVHTRLLRPLQPGVCVLVASFSSYVFTLVSLLRCSLRGTTALLTPPPPPKSSVALCPCIVRLVLPLPSSSLTACSPLGARDHPHKQVLSPVLLARTAWAVYKSPALPADTVAPSKSVTHCAMVRQLSVTCLSCFTLHCSPHTFFRAFNR